MNINERDVGSLKAYTVIFNLYEKIGWHILPKPIVMTTISDFISLLSWLLKIHIFDLYMIQSAN